MKNMFLRSFVFLALVGSGLAVDKVAVTTRKEGDVKLKSTTRAEILELQRGTLLHDQDQITSGADGAALILFLDDKSQLKLKGNTEVIISGTRGDVGISKRISLDRGTLKASITEQRRGDFIIETPTSVASVKGTEFWIITTPGVGDLIISNTGTIELVNSVTGETITVPAGIIVESTQDGQVNVLQTMKISARAVGSVSGGQFAVQDIQVLEGGVDPGAFSGSIFVSDNTVFEGAAVAAGNQVTVRGAFDAQSGNLVASLVEVASPLVVEATATSAPVAGRFDIGDATVTQGQAAPPPGVVRISDNTVIEGGNIVTGAQVTVTGFFNSETGVINASHILVVIPERMVTLVTVTGTAQSGISNNQFLIAGVGVVDGNVDAAHISGVIQVSDTTEFTGCDLTTGIQVQVRGIYDDSTQVITAAEVNVAVLRMEATVASPITNDQFQITDITVLEGGIDPASLSGIIQLTDETEVDRASIQVNTVITIESCVAGGAAGIIVATEVMVGEAPERQLIIRLEDARGNRKDLLITF